MKSPLIRSFLFVPADNERLLASALTKPCDAVILDLEDGIHASKKESARQTLEASYTRLKAAGKISVVRINGDLNTAITDLRAAVLPGLDLLMLPKVEHPRDVQLLATVVAGLERSAGIPAGHLRFVLQIESALALPKLYEIAAADRRVLGMMLGSEDFSLDCGAIPTPETLMMPSMMVLFACRAAKIQPIGFVGSIAELGAPEVFKARVEQARSLGFRGAVVVHPKYLEIINDCFTPSAAQLEQALKIIQAFEAADANGVGAIQLDGQMIDKPVYQRALDLTGRS
jgi:citrate lyase subunit beta/citryl-CoA lyase